MLSISMDTQQLDFTTQPNVDVPRQDTAAIYHAACDQLHVSPLLQVHSFNHANLMVCFL